MIEKFKAATVKEAMKLAKESVGEEAIILESKKIKEGGLFDINKSEMIEITVTAEKSQNSQTIQGRASKVTYSPADVKKSRNFNADIFGYEIKNQITHLKESISKMSDYLRFSKMLLMPETLAFLVNEKGVDENLASELVQKIFCSLYGEDLKNKLKIRNALHQEIDHRLHVQNNRDLPKDKVKSLCFVGPTGMGKTTTLLKMATNPDFYSQHDTAIITIDTYRVAAAAQLRTFAALAKLPLEIAYEPAEYAKALDKFKDKEIILIDTAGRSPLNTYHLQELQEYFSISMPDEIHLVLSVSMRADNLFDAVNSFSSLPVNRLIISKIDETLRIGNILNITQKINLPISFLTNGQSVPEHILSANSEEIANMILN